MSINFYIFSKLISNLYLRRWVLLLILIFVQAVYPSDNIICIKGNDLIFVAEKTITHQFNAHLMPLQSINKCLNDVKNENTIFITQTGQIHNLHLITHAQIVFNQLNNKKDLKILHDQSITYLKIPKTCKVNNNKQLSKIKQVIFKTQLPNQCYNLNIQLVYTAVLIFTKKKILNQSKTDIINIISNNLIFLKAYHTKHLFEYEQVISHIAISEAYNVRPPPLV